MYYVSYRATNLRNVRITSATEPWISGTWTMYYVSYRATNLQNLDYILRQLQRHESPEPDYVLRQLQRHESPEPDYVLRQLQSHGFPEPGLCITSASHEATFATGRRRKDKGRRRKSWRRRKPRIKKERKKSKFAFYKEKLILITTHTKLTHYNKNSHTTLQYSLETSLMRTFSHTVDAFTSLHFSFHNFHRLLEVRSRWEEGNVKRPVFHIFHRLLEVRSRWEEGNVKRPVSHNFQRLPEARREWEEGRIERPQFWDTRLDHPLLVHAAQL